MTPNFLITFSTLVILYKYNIRTFKSIEKYTIFVHVFIVGKLDNGLMQIWIKNRLRELGKTQVELGEKLGLPHARISEMIKGTRELKAREVPALAKYLEISAREVVEAFAGELEQVVENAIKLRNVTVSLHAEAGVWQDSPEWSDPDEWYDVSIPADPAYHGIRLYGAEVRGPSINKRYAEGSVVIFTNVIETDEAYIPGRRYIVARTSKDNGQHEATVKLLHQDKEGGLWLMPESDDPRFQSPIKLDHDPDYEIRIVGRVVGSYQREK